MSIHLTPTELAREAGLERREVITKCMEMGVPIFEGRIDKTQFNMFSADEGADVGQDGETPVTEDYAERDNKFTGTIEKVTVELK